MIYTWSWDGTLTWHLTSIALILFKCIVILINWFLLSYSSKSQIVWVFIELNRIGKESLLLLSVVLHKWILFGSRFKVEILSSNSLRDIVIRRQVLIIIKKTFFWSIIVIFNFLKTWKFFFKLLRRRSKLWILAQ